MTDVTDLNRNGGLRSWIAFLFALAGSIGATLTILVIGQPNCTMTTHHLAEIEIAACAIGVTGLVVSFLIARQAWRSLGRWRIPLRFLVVAICLAPIPLSFGQFFTFSNGSCGA